MAAPIAPPPPAPAPNQPGVLSRLLRSISSVYSDPNDAALLGMASGFGAASAPHMLTPVSAGQAMSMANQGAQQYRQQMVGANIQQEAALPYQVMRTNALERAFHDSMNPALPAHQRAAAAYQVDSLMGWNAASDPTVANRLAAIKAAYTPVPQGPGTTLTTASKVAGGAGSVAHGAVPEGSTYDPATNSVQQAAGAPGAIASNAANKAGGAAAATLPYQLAQHYVTRAPGTAGGTLGPMPGPFAPVQAPNLGLNPAAQQAAMQRMIGLQTGLTNAAQATGRQGPMPVRGVGPSGGFPQRTSEGVAPPGSLAAERAAGAENLPAVMGQLRAAQGAPAPGAQRPLLTLTPGRGAQPAPPPQAGGIFSNGESPAALAAQKAIGAETAGQVKEATAGEDAARKQLALYNEMSVALSRMGPTGAWRDVTLPLAHVANYFGFTPGNITSAAEFDKYRVQLVGAATRGVSPRASTQEMDFLAKQVPNYNMPGTAPRILLSQLRGLSQYEIVKGNALTTYLETVAQRRGGAFRGTSMGFAKWWVNNGPSPSSIVLASTLAGLSPAERGAYVGKLRKSLTGRHMIKQYERAEAFEQRYPGIFKGL